MELVAHLKDSEANCLHFHCLSYQDEILAKLDLLDYIYLDNHKDKRSDSNYTMCIHPKNLM